MENIEKFAEYAPIIVILLLYLRQNNLFVKPEQLEKKHREIVDEIETKIRNKYVEVNAYKEFQNHIYSKLDEVNHSLDEIKGVLMTRRKDDNS